MRKHKDFCKILWQKTVFWADIWGELIKKEINQLSNRKSVPLLSLFALCLLRGGNVALGSFRRKCVTVGGGKEMPRYEPQTDWKIYNICHASVSITYIYVKTETHDIARR